MVENWTKRRKMAVTQKTSNGPHRPLCSFFAFLLFFLLTRAIQIHITRILAERHTVSGQQVFEN